MFQERQKKKKKRNGTKSNRRVTTGDTGKGGGRTKGGGKNEYGGERKEGVGELVKSRGGCTNGGERDSLVNQGEEGLLGRERKSKKKRG